MRRRRRIEDKSIVLIALEVKSGRTGLFCEKGRGK
jgi:hypothetical protein